MHLLRIKALWTRWITGGFAGMGVNLHYTGADKASTSVIRIERKIESTSVPFSTDGGKNNGADARSSYGRVVRIKI